MAVEFSKSEIDRLGDDFRAGPVSPVMLIKLDDYRRSHRSIYENVVDVVSRQLRLEVTGRPSKSTGAVVEKLKREKIRLSQVQDVAGCRVVVEAIPEQNLAVGAIEVFLSAAVVDRRSSPSHGYRAVHLVARSDGRAVEIQVRTRLQHLWAELSEKLSDTVDSGLKYGQGDRAALEFLTRLSDAIADFEHEESERADALRHLEASQARLAKPLRKQLKLLERRYSSRRSRLLELLSNIHNMAFRK